MNELNFIDIEETQPTPQTVTPTNGLSSIESMASLQIGYGAKGFRADLSGIWLGASKWADAPFRVDMLGNLVASSGTFTQYLSKTGASQEFTGDIQVGNAVGVKIDGANKRIVLYDGSANPIIVIGYVA